MTGGQKEFWADHTYELENRIRNLIWTVSGDYSLQPRVDAESFCKSPDMAVYEGVRQGGLARFLDQDEIALYLLKKLYRHAEQAPLMEVAQICVEAAVGHRLDAEREGVAGLRKRAYEEMLEDEFSRLTGYPLGRLKIAFLQSLVMGRSGATADNRRWLSRLKELSSDISSADVIRLMDELYNDLVDPSFEKKYGSLQEVLAVSLEDLREFTWEDLLNEDAESASLEVVLERITEDMLSLDVPAAETGSGLDQAEPVDVKKKILLVDEAVLEKAHLYVERNFGKTWLTPAEEKSLNRRVCKGIHRECSIFFTDGILHAPVMVNNQYVLADKQKSKNIEYFYQHYTVVKRNIAELTEMLRKALAVRSESLTVRSDHGQIAPNQLWKIGRSRDAELFTRTRRAEEVDFAIDILIDASGSQRKRQMQVALQAYIFSEALSNLDIPFRVMSFCTFWDYTVLRRFREYEEDREANRRIFEFTTSSNNRDGLAVRAVGEGLLRREESKKILILLSDGKPYDVMIRRQNARNPEPYSGREAVLDTGREVRSLRRQDVSVLGVFVGEESELDAEKRIFGRDFAYIRSIDHFAKIAGRFLLKQIEE